MSDPKQSFGEWFDAGGAEAVVSEATIEAELARAAGLDRKTRTPVYKPQVGRQVIQLVQFPFFEGGRWDTDYCAVDHYHAAYEEPRNENRDWLQRRPFIYDEGLIRKYREEYGLRFNIPCQAKMFGENCEACEAKFTIGNWYKENTDDGWKNEQFKDDCKRWGLWTDTDIWAYVRVIEDAGTWLDSKEGQKWARLERKKLKGGKQGKRAVTNFDRSSTRAKDRVEDIEEQRNEFGEVVMLAEIGKELHKSLEQLVRSADIGGALGAWVNGVELEVIVSVNPDNGIIGMPRVRPIGRSHLVTNEDGTPDMEAIKTIVSRLKPLRAPRYMLDQHPDLASAFAARVDEILDIHNSGGHAEEFASQLPDTLGPGDTTPESRYGKRQVDEDLDDEFDDDDDDDETDDEEKPETAATLQILDELPAEDQVYDVEASGADDDDDDDESTADDGDDFDDDDDEESPEDYTDVGEDSDVATALAAFTSSDLKALKLSLRGMNSDQLATVCARIGIAPEAADGATIAAVLRAMPSKASPEPTVLAPTTEYQGDRPRCFRKGVKADDHETCVFCPFDMDCN